MNLGGRAALSVPLISLLASAFLGLFDMATQPSDALIAGWSTFRLVFVYSTILSLPVGYFLAIPALLLGHHLPKPTWLWLGLIGLMVGFALAIVLAGGVREIAHRGTIGLAMMGILCGGLWWLFVERHRDHIQDEPA